MVSEKKFGFEKNILRSGDNSYLDGYWQSPAYFSAYADIIRHDCRLAKPLSEHAELILSKMNAASSVSVHVRRGDYVNDPKTNAYHGTCSLDYYKKAVEIIRNKVKDPVFFIFSDDAEWVKKNFNIDEQQVLVSEPEKLSLTEELKLMASCRHSVVANSSFSWWGAWLNNNNEKMVIAPQKWFADPLIDTSDLIPSAWIRI